MTRRNSIWKQLAQWRVPARILGFLSLIVGFAGVIEGPIPYPPIPGLEMFHRNISSELIGIGVTVLIIDVANERRAKKQLKAQLVREMGSKDYGIALRAVEELRVCGWLEDGSLRGKAFLGAALEGADLEGADLEGASFAGAGLEEANLSYANLQHAIFAGASLEKAKLWGANLRNVDLSNANLVDTEFLHANLEGAYLVGANLQGTNLRWTNMRKAILNGTSLKANLGYAKLNQAEFINIDVRGADLYGADLQGVIYFGRIEDLLSKANTLRGAILPDGSLYNGRFNLAGDISWARSLKNNPDYGKVWGPGEYGPSQEVPGIDTKDPVAMAEFYGVTVEDYQRGQSRARDHLV